jgi:Zn-dependent protease with chaperone function
MTFEERRVAVETLTRSAQSSPRLYRIRVALWIVIGYALLLTIAVTALALGVGAVVALIQGKALGLIKIAWIPLVFAWMVLRTLLVKVDPPPGRITRSQEAPRLVEFVEDVRRRIGVGPLTDIRITRDMNASVAEIPRLGGLLGWKRYLVIGFPMLLVHSVEELRAILGHEFGHLSGRHGRLGAWTWRVRESWARLDASLHGHHGVTAKTMRKLFHWYSERLFAMTIVQSRHHELGADLAAAEWSGAEVSARALAWTVVADGVLDRSLWKALWDRAEIEEKPGETPFALLRRNRLQILSSAHGDLYDAALASTTATDDTHPALAERLAALGVQRPEVGPAPTAAAEELMPELTTRLVAEFDSEWTEAVLPVWQARHDEVLRAREALSDESPSADTLDAAALRARAASLSAVGREEEAIAAYTALLKQQPSDPETAFILGNALLQKNDLAGIDHISEAMKRDWRYVGPGCETVYAALRARGMEREAGAWAERARQHVELLEAAEAESLTLRVSDTILSPSLPEETREALVEFVGEEGWVKHAWLGKKMLTMLPGAESHFVALSPRMFRFIGSGSLQHLVSRIQLDQPVTFLVVTSGELRRKIQQSAAQPLF